MVERKSFSYLVGRFAESLSRYKWEMLFVAIGLWMTFEAIAYSYAKRGGFEVGGEFLILPLMYVLRSYWRTVKEGWEEL